MLSCQYSSIEQIILESVAAGVDHKAAIEDEEAEKGEKAMEESARLLPEAPTLV